MRTELKFNKIMLIYRQYVFSIIIYLNFFKIVTKIFFLKKEDLFLLHNHLNPLNISLKLFFTN